VHEPCEQEAHAAAVAVAPSGPDPAVEEQRPRTRLARRCSPVTLLWGFAGHVFILASIGSSAKRLRDRHGEDLRPWPRRS
jgi:hypothetical protein